MVKKVSKKINIKEIIKFTVIAVVIVIIFFFAKEIIKNVDTITKFAESAGIFGPLLLIALIALGILFTPIPSFVLIIAAGYLYGIWWGSLYSYIGHLIAATSAYAVSKHSNILNGKGKLFKKYYKLVKDREHMLYLMYLIPVFPISITSIISASTNVTWKKFMKIILISFAPTVLFFSFFGNRINNQNINQLIIMMAVILIGAFIIERRVRKIKEIKSNNNK